MSRKRLREEFIRDCCFGMPGLPADKAGACQLDEVTDLFINAQTEAVYQVWKRGRASCTIDVRNELMRLANAGDAAIDHIEAGNILNHLQAISLAAKPPGG